MFVPNLPISDHLFHPLKITNRPITGICFISFIQIPINNSKNHIVIHPVTIIQINTLYKSGKVRIYNDFIRINPMHDSIIIQSHIQWYYILQTSPFFPNLLICNLLQPFLSNTGFLI